MKRHALGPARRRPFAGGASVDSACGSSTSARRLAALSLRRPVSDSTVLTPACAKSLASVSGAKSIDGDRNGRPDCKHARIGAIASGDFFARIPIGRSAGGSPDRADARRYQPCSEARRSSSLACPRSAPAHRAPARHGRRSARRVMSRPRCSRRLRAPVPQSLSVQPWMLSAWSRPVPIRSPAAPLPTSSAAIFGSVIALRARQDRRAGVDDGVEQQAAAVRFAGTPFLRADDLVVDRHDALSAWTTEENSS